LYQVSYLLAILVRNKLPTTVIEINTSKSKFNEYGEQVPISYQLQGQHHHVAGIKEMNYTIL